MAVYPQPQPEALTANLLAGAGDQLGEVTATFRELERGAEDNLTLILVQRALSSLEQIGEDLLYLRDTARR